MFGVVWGLFRTGVLVGFVVVLVWFLKLALAREQAVFNIGTQGYRATNRNQKLYALFPRALNSTPDGRHLITSLSKVHQRMPWI